MDHPENTPEIIEPELMIFARDYGFIRLYNGACAGRDIPGIGDFYRMFCEHRKKTMWAHNGKIYEARYVPDTRPYIELDDYSNTCRARYIKPGIELIDCTDNCSARLLTESCTVGELLSYKITFWALLAVLFVFFALPSQNPLYVFSLFAVAGAALLHFYTIPERIYYHTRVNYPALSYFISTHEEVLLWLLYFSGLLLWVFLK